MKIFTYISEGKEPLTYDDLVRLHYPSEAPFNARHIIGGHVRSLINKIEYNKESIVIDRIKKPGHKVKFRVARRKRR